MALSPIVLVLHVIFGVLTALHALLYKRDPRAAMSWIALCLAVPLLGPFLYVVFGINRVQKRAQKLLENTDFNRGRFSLHNPLTQMHTSHGLSPPHQTHSSELNNLSQSQLKIIKRFTAASDTLCHHELLTNNQVSILHNGDEAYPAMLDAIRSAQNHVYLMTYIFQPDTIGKEFIEALVEAHERGVEVKVIVDGIADWYYWPRSSRRMQRKGLNVETFLALSWYPPSIGFNLRNHKKLLIVDDQFAFTGGLNITDINCQTVKGKNNKHFTRDMHFQIQGPVIEQCYALFIEAWTFVTKDELQLPNYSFTSSGAMTCRALVDGPDESIDRIELIIISAINIAQESVRIMTPYFLPSNELISALNTAAIRGIRVEVIIPERSDNLVADWAGRNLHWELLQRNVKIYCQPAPFSHSKIFVIDGSYALIGSANIDTRSLRLNYELMVEVINADLATELYEHCGSSIRVSREMTLQEADGRSFARRLRDSIAWLFVPYL